MIRSVKDRKSWQFSKSWDIRNTSSMNELAETLHGGHSNEEKRYKAICINNY
jgi:hypothetical protein